MNLSSKTLIEKIVDRLAVDDSINSQQFSSEAKSFKFGEFETQEQNLAKFILEGLRDCIRDLHRWNITDAEKYESIKDVVPSKVDEAAFLFSMFYQLQKVGLTSEEKEFLAEMMVKVPFYYKRGGEHFKYNVLPLYLVDSVMLSDEEKEGFPYDFSYLEYESRMILASLILNNCPFYDIVRMWECPQEVAYSIKQRTPEFDSFRFERDIEQIVFDFFSIPKRIKAHDYLSKDKIFNSLRDEVEGLAFIETHTYINDLACGPHLYGLQSLLRLIQRNPEVENYPLEHAKEVCGIPTTKTPYLTKDLHSLILDLPAFYNHCKEQDFEEGMYYIQKIQEYYDVCVLRKDEESAKIVGQFCESRGIRNLYEYKGENQNIYERFETEEEKSFLEAQSDEESNFTNREHIIASYREFLTAYADKPREHNSFFMNGRAIILKLNSYLKASLETNVLEVHGYNFNRKSYFKFIFAPESYHLGMGRVTENNLVYHRTNRVGIWAGYWNRAGGKEKFTGMAFVKDAICLRYIPMKAKDFYKTSACYSRSLDIDETAKVASLPEMHSDYRLRLAGADSSSKKMTYKNVFFDRENNFSENGNVISYKSIPPKTKAQETRERKKKEKEQEKERLAKESKVYTFGDFRSLLHDGVTLATLHEIFQMMKNTPPHEQERIFAYAASMFKELNLMSLWAIYKSFYRKEEKPEGEEIKLQEESKEKKEERGRRKDMLERSKKYFDFYSKHCLPTSESKNKLVYQDCEGVHVDKVVEDETYSVCFFNREGLPEGYDSMFGVYVKEGDVYNIEDCMANSMLTKADDVKVYEYGKLYLYKQSSSFKKSLLEAQISKKVKISDLR